MLFVDKGYCNDPTWASSHEGHVQMVSGGDCDGGLGYGALAVSLFQIHPEEGIVLTQDGGWSRAFNFSPEWRAIHSGEILLKSELLEDRKNAVRVALHFVRQSLTRSGGLCAYTGEPGPCPKAAARLNFARNWWTRHPFKQDE